MADTTILSWITAEVDQALELVRRNIALYEAAPDDPAVLGACPEHLHQVSGALSMVGLSGATHFCEVLEGSFAPLNGSPPSAAAMAVIDRGVLALKKFVDDLAQGQPNIPVRLFPAYRELAELHGRSDSSEKDLFFPDLTPPAPVHPNARALASGELPAFLQAQRGRFQRGLLAWLRNQPGGLDEMREALDSLYTVAPQLPERRALWWVAVGLIDGLLNAPPPDWQARARVLCNRIDFQIRDLAAGSQAISDPLLRELLYAIARCRPLTQRIKETKQLYRLDHLMPPPEPVSGRMEYDMDRLQPALEDARSRLAALKSTWQQYVAGEPKSVLRFRELLGSLNGKAAELGNQHLIRLLDAISLAAARLPDAHPQKEPYMVIEMASAFLLAESVIDSFATPPDDLEAQVRIMSGWLLDAADDKSSGEPPDGMRTDLTQQIGALQLRAQVAKEIIVNLQHVEQALDGYARGKAERATLQGLGSSLRQIHGALTVLRFERAAEVLAACESMIQACAGAASSAGRDDMDWIAEGLSSIGFFLAPCLGGREPRVQSIDLFCDRFAKRAAPATPSAPDPEPVTQNNELLGVFLEEAREVVAAIEATVPQSRAEPGNSEALARIRRGFHTLKGSGRMVGLTDLGEAAWEIEQVMNRWLEQKKPASAELLELAATAASSFRQWLGKLGNGEPLALEAQPILDLARKLKAEEQQLSAEAEEVVIGEVALARSFFEVYLKEAAGHVATLETSADASEEFMRAAHTLASSSRTAGFAPIADLAAAIEQWAPLAGRSVPRADAGTVRAAIGKLKDMVKAVEQRRAPAPAAELLGRLRALTARLLAPPAKPQPAPASGKEQRAMRDDIDEQLFPVFLEEAQELVPQIGADLRDWQANPEDRRIPESLKRALHTLKGSARMAGAIRLGELTHLMESRVDAADTAEPSPQLFEELEAKLDRLSADLDRMRQQGAALRATAAAEPPLPSPAAMLRITTDTLDYLITESGEVAIARSRIETELRQVKQALGDLNDSIERLRSQLREVEIQADSQMQSRRSVLDERERDFDPLEFDRYTRLQELTRMMAEGLNDAASIQQALLKSLGETDAALLQQARISRELQQDLMRMRAVPFSHLGERLHRVVRQTARELGKKAELEIESGQVELDRSVLERIAAPLEHMLRNALAHGVEAPAGRGAAGKPQAGRIVISLRQEANEIALVLSDDGAGIDGAKLHRRAVEKGLLAADTALSDVDKAQLVFLSGLSTADSVTELAGRGVGMDVVRTEIGAIGGRVDIATTPGEGTTFTVYLPLTLAVTQTVLVRAGARMLAISAATVEQVLRVKADALVGLYEQGKVDFQDRSYPLHYLQQLLGTRAPAEIQDYNSVLLLRSGIQRVAVHVDQLYGSQEMVVKNIGPQLARIQGVAGATVVADGSIVLIVNPVQLAQRGRSTMARTLAPELVSTNTARMTAPLVMVVDDSLTVRKITSRLLEREGYRVKTAKDGVDALEQLKDGLPAVMLVDIEMPRMDGFDLAKALRGDPRTLEIPIIIISSRTADKHRNRGAELGVSVFLGKPYQESELLQRVAACLRA